MANQEHLDILKKGVEAWNKWREESPHVKPDLSNVAIFEESGEIRVIEINSDKDRSRLMTELMNSYKGVNLSNINLRGANLNRSILIRAILKKADLRSAKFKEANLFNAYLVGSEFSGANLQGIMLNNAELQGTVLSYINLQKAVLSYAKFQKSWLIQINLQEAILLSAELQGAEILSSKLQGANFSYAMVDGETWIDETVEVDQSTYFEGVGLDAMRIDPGIKQLLEYNIRRKKWEEWYKVHPKLRWVCRPFWWVSKYGLSTGRIIAAFFGLAVAFACIYYVCGTIAPPGIIDYLFVDGNGVKIACWLVPIRAIHFSVVIMTVGFTNMHANAHSFWAHILVSLQMILGFVLLAALVTRFAVLFTAGGPAGKFAKETKATEDTEKNGFPPARE